MKIHSITLKNFRGYREETTVSFLDLTAFVGRNDIGKSSVMEALDIFFNEDKPTVKLDKNDLNVEAKNLEDTDICITVRFSDLPGQIVVDAACETSLSQEYLLNAEGLLEVVKHYPNGGKAKVFLRALNPRNPDCADLILKKNTELRKIITDKDIQCEDKTRNPVMRAAIWERYADDLRLEETELEVTKGDVKSIWEKLQKYLPHYSLFQADRKNSDADSEVQDPLKAEVAKILKSEELQEHLDFVAQKVLERLNLISDKALEKLQLMNPEVASVLTPVIPAAESLKWTEVFKNVSISGDDSIPINKRGSGTKRLILLSFFQAALDHTDEDDTGTIYAIEEPETALHHDNQRSMIKALKELAQRPNVQVIITTHSASVVKELDLDCVRVIRKENERRVINNALPRVLNYISLNEVSYLAFGGAAEEYHDELYGYLDITRRNGTKLLTTFRNTQRRVRYIRIGDNGNHILQQLTKTEYIRHQIHHPENKENARFQHHELIQSIQDMRDFIQANP